MVQVFEQPVPSPLKRPFGPVHPFGNLVGSVPQSHASPVSTMPLPHTDFLQTLGDPVQLQPGSIEILVRLVFCARDEVVSRSR